MKTFSVVLAMTLPLVAAAQPVPENPILLGAGVRSRPAYDGSRSQRTDIIPVLRYYGRPWFARTTQGMLEAGARSELAPDFWAGAQIAYEAGRKKSESPFLAGRNEPDLDVGVSAGLHVEWDRKLGQAPINFLIRARQHLDSDRGGQVDLRITAGVFSRAGFQAGVFWQATWGSQHAVRSMYEVPHASLMFFSTGLLGSYDLSRHWVLVGSAERRSLQDEVAGSPLTERKASYYASAGVAYRF
jgi:outer membrane scaffolding protein for murein synthesis (MipA/OmpV family)